MAWCPKCKNEYVDGITTCKDCGCELTEHLTEESSYEYIPVENQEIIDELVEFLHFSSIESAEKFHDTEDNIFILRVDEKDYQSALMYVGVYLKKESTTADISTPDTTSEEGSQETAIPDTETYTLEDSVPEPETYTLEDSVPEPETSTLEDSVPEPETSTLEDNVSEPETSILEDSIPESETSTLEDSVPDTETFTLEDSVSESNIIDEKIDTTAPDELAVDNEEHFSFSSSSYTRLSDKYEDTKSSAYTLLFVGFAGILFIILESVGLFTFPISTQTKWLFYTVMGGIFIVFIIAGIISQTRAKQLKIEVDKEDKIIDDILSWFKENYTAESIDKEVDTNVDFEIIYFNRSDYMKNIIMHQFEEVNEALVDDLIESLYQEFYESDTE